MCACGREGEREAGWTPAQIAGGGGCASCCSSILENLREAVKLVEVLTFNQSLERSEHMCSAGLA